VGQAKSNGHDRCTGSFGWQVEGGPRRSGPTRAGESATGREGENAVRRPHVVARFPRAAAKQTLGSPPDRRQARGPHFQRVLSIVSPAQTAMRSASFDSLRPGTSETVAGLIKETTTPSSPDRAHRQVLADAAFARFIAGIRALPFRDALSSVM